MFSFCANVVKCCVLKIVAGEGGAGMVHADIFGTVQGVPSVNLCFHEMV